MSSGVEREGRELIGNLEILLMIRDVFSFSLYECIFTYLPILFETCRVDFPNSIRINSNVTTPLENHPSRHTQCEVVLSQLLFPK